MQQQYDVAIIGTGIGGSTLAAELKAVSADHMNYTDPSEYALLREAGVVCVVMPALDFSVGHSRPFDARAMLDAGVTLALATDMCPGCWLESMPFVVQLACRLYKFSPAEAILAGTRHAAMALDRADRIGSLEPGKQADIAIFPFEPSPSLRIAHSSRNGVNGRWSASILLITTNFASFNLR